jgi:hypothetical protein
MHRCGEHKTKIDFFRFFDFHFRKINFRIFIIVAFLFKCLIVMFDNSSFFWLSKKHFSFFELKNLLDRLLYLKKQSYCLTIYSILYKIYRCVFELLSPNWYFILSVVDIN